MKDAPRLREAVLVARVGQASKRVQRIPRGATGNLLRTPAPQGALTNTYPTRSPHAGFRSIEGIDNECRCWQIEPKKSRILQWTRLWWPSLCSTMVYFGVFVFKVKVPALCSCRGFPAWINRARFLARYHFHAGFYLYILSRVAERAVHFMKRS